MRVVFSLILLIIFAIGFGYFATFNVVAVPIIFGSIYTVSAVPLYIVIAGSLLVGLFLSWLITFFTSLSSHYIMRHKDREINSGKSTIHTMTKQINDLEIENSNLKGELKNEPFDDGSL